MESLDQAVALRVVGRRLLDDVAEAVAEFLPEVARELPATVGHDALRDAVAGGQLTGRKQIARAKFCSRSKRPKNNLKTL